MKESIKYLKFLFVSNIIFLFVACGSDKKDEEEFYQDDEPLIYMAQESLNTDDSITMVLNKYNLNVINHENVNDVLNHVLEKRNKLLKKLDSLDEKSQKMERMTYDYLRREEEKLRKELVAQIDELNNELDKIKTIAIKNEIKEKKKLIIPEKKLEESLKSIEDLKPGNYTTRLNRYYIISARVTDEGEIFFSEPKLDSTTVIRGNVNLNPRVQKELKEIKDQYKLDNNE